MMNPAPCFWPIVGPWGPTAGPGSLGTGSGSKNSSDCTKNQPRRPVIRPIRGYFGFVVPASKETQMVNISPPKISPAQGPENN